MLDHGTIRDLYKTVDRVNSSHLIIGEWNMNKYQEISAYGVYKNPLTAALAGNRVYDANSSNILTGENFLIYEDNTKKVDPAQEFFSNLTSVFLPNRPDPGIILLQKYGNNVFVPNSTTFKIENIGPDNPRYYPFSYTRPYDYFNTCKVMGLNNNDTGVVSDADGSILCASPYVVYSASFSCNKITIKVQKHLSVPKEFSIDVLISGTWQEVFPKNLSSAALFNTGILDIYYNGSTWTTTVNRVTELSELSSAAPTQLKNIQGLRLIVYKMSTTTPGTYGLELIELSPRLEIDLTEYTESFSFNSSIGDTTNIGLPVGSIVSSTGNISLSNENDEFLFSSTMNSLKMLNPDTKFTFYQKVNTNSGEEIIPIKTMYSNEWNVGQDYSAEVSLEDGMKFLRETSAADLLLQTNTGTSLSSAILTLLDNAGITGFRFVQSSMAATGSGENVKIKNFFCKKEQTVAEVLEQLAISTQCAMFHDAEGILNVLTKERLTEKVIIDDSTSSVSGTDMWFVFNEDYTNLAGTGNASEYNYVSSYNSNIINYNEIKINPMTDGDISYHTYGPRKVPGAQTLPENVLKELTTDFPAAALAFSNYSYATKILWTTGNDNSSVLGAANLVLDLNGDKLNTIFTRNYTALNEEEAIRLIYQSTNITASFGGSTAAALNAKQNLIIFIDRNEGYTIPDYEGYILIDKEYIKYRGKLYSINGTLKIIFSEEELKQHIRYLPKGSSISIIGLVVDVVLKVISQSGANYTYNVIEDGRNKFNSEISIHYALAENSDGINIEKQFKLTLGESKNYSTPGSLLATTKFNFIDKNKFISAKDSIGSLSYNDLQSYLGFLKISGPKSPAQDLAIIEDLDVQGSTPSIISRLNQMNKQVDKSVPGDFDDYVYMQGERNIYGQVIDLPFVPNTISTRMRLFSSTKKRKNDQYIMSTNSSIAGIGFGLNSNNEGYFVEVESIGAGKDSIAKEAAKNNLRMYKIFLNRFGKYEPKLLFTAPVAAQTVSNTEVQVLKNTNTADPVFEIEIQIEQYSNGMKYSVYYGDTYVNSYIEPIGPAINVNSKRIFMFVRNDSQAIYEWFAAAARPRNKTNSGYFKSKTSLDQAIQSGIIPVNKDFLFKNDDIQYYFNDFARLVRQVREIDIRYEAPAFSTALVDISKINPEYLIKKAEFTAFGAKIIVGNTSSGPIILGEESNLPLYIVGIGLEELSAGKISMKDYYDLVDEKKRKVTTREKNISIYGAQSFNLDSQYIQTMAQAKNMMKWITQYCNRQRIKMSLEIFSNPLIQLGDKVRIYDKTRGYIQENSNFGDRVFTVSSISHSVNNSGPSMTIEIIEVG